MILRIENLEINMKGVFKALLLAGVGMSLYEAMRSPRIYAAHVILRDQKKEKKASTKNEKVESV